MSKKLLTFLAVLVGVFLVVLAFVYFLTPANNLPAFIPGHESGLSKAHYKHGIGSLILGLLLFAFAWFQGGKKKSTS